MAGAHHEAGERRGVIPTFARWLEDRTGFASFVRGFLNESIPGSAGWPQVFGSVALFLLLIQAFTGILLALNYAPTPGDAYYSLQYIIEKVTGGRMIRGLHHWGASAMVIVVVLHMIQVFLYGAYKKPREVTWIVGVALLVLTLTFGLTGYLLPWDNRAYWGTVVTTRIAGQAPVFGSYIQRLLGGEAGVGVLTFARFYALHTLVLPALAAILVGLHLILVRRHGVAPAPVESKPERRFYPAQAFKDTCAMFVVFVILFLLAATVEVPLERMADPTDSTAIPRPEWYFLFLFQILKFFPGPAEWVGSVVLPTVALVVLCAVPFLDRSRWRRVTERTAAIGLVVLAVIGWASLTVTAAVTTPRPHMDRQAAEMASRLPPEATPEELAGLGLFRSAHCSNCHNLLDGAPKAGPTLAMSPRLKPADEMAEHFQEAGRRGAG